MKKINILILLSLFLACTSSCQKSDSVTNFKDIPFSVQEGDSFTSSFEAQGQTVATYRVKAKNFGSEEEPVLIFIKDYYSATKDYADVFTPLLEAQLRRFIPFWAASKGLSLTPEGLTKAYASFKHYFTKNSIDPAVFIALSFVEDSEATISTLCQVVEMANSEYYSNTGSLKPTDVNGVLNYLYKSQVSVQEFDQLLSSSNQKPIRLVKTLLANGISPQEFGQICTKGGTASKAIKIIKNLKACADLIIDLVDQESTCSFDSGYISVLSEMDVDPANYGSGRTYRSEDFSVKYNYSKCTYHIEAEYGNAHPNFFGKFIKTIYVNPTHASVSAGKLIGSVTYSNPINIGSTADDPIAKVYCSVNIQYGDCCCFQFYLNHNFTIDAANGYNKESYDDGR